MRLIHCLCLLLVALMSEAPACLWDRDTLKAEASGQGDVVNAILARFDRFPAAYYEARITRVVAELAADPSRLDLYDDAAVAYDRLNRSDAAITIMEQKRKKLDALAANDPLRTEHEYRHLANLGTFYAHRWVSAGADRTQPADLLEAKRLIAAAIELNPDAHFGRERYQLFAIEWLLATPDEDTPPMIMLPKDKADKLLRARGRSDNGLLAQLNIADAPKGISGLITMGAGAESIDLMHTLDRVLAAEGRSYVGELAHQRVLELVEGGRRSLDPAVAKLTKDEIMGLFARRSSTVEDQKELAEWFLKARAAANERQAARMKYLDEMLARGEHPDTHEAIWAKAPDGPPLPPMNVGGDTQTRVAFGALAIAVLAILAVVALSIRSVLKRFRPATN